MFSLCREEKEDLWALYATELRAGFQEKCVTFEELTDLFSFLEIVPRRTVSYPWKCVMQYLWALGIYRVKSIHAGNSNKWEHKRLAATKLLQPGFTQL